MLATEVMGYALLAAAVLAVLALNVWNLLRPMTADEQSELDDEMRIW